MAAWLARLAIECKRHAKASPALMKGWWAQAEVQAETCGLVPALAYRQDRASWRFVLPMSELVQELPQWPGIEHTVELSVAGFAALARERSETPRLPGNAKTQNYLKQSNLALRANGA
ncbi:hypothetical protein [Halochromatium roseum]|uniref:putative PDDEXK endonuclease n=1 Tax=Halochromatium roseum TaxID=391920 RepID=UPI0019141B33|nr:hypothetical protein [Halochromatium roseum]MBK5938875.1 hypothetical protein [Halochromatium roseum]